MYFSGLYMPGAQEYYFGVNKKFDPEAEGLKNVVFKVTFECLEWAQTLKGSYFVSITRI